MIAFLTRLAAGPRVTSGLAVLALLGGCHRHHAHDGCVNG